MNQALEDIRAVLTAIAEGYAVTVEDDRYIMVDNPDYEPDNGHDPRLFLDVAPLFQKAECLDCMGLGARQIDIGDYDICKTCGGSGEIGPLIT